MIRGAGRSLDRSPSGDILKGLAGGAIGGLVASLVMNQVHTVTGMLKRAGAYSGNGHLGDRGIDPPAATGRRRLLPTPAHESGTEKAARKLAGWFGRRLTRRQKRRASPAVHYGFGTLAGGAYGAIAEWVPRARIGFGIPFGLFVWIAGDEVALPLLGLGRRPWTVPASVHAESLAAHVVFGLTSEAALRFLRPSFPPSLENVRELPRAGWRKI